MPFQLEVTDTFSAAHAITIAGEREPVHGHDWRVTVIVERDELDADGLVADFHALQGALADVLRPFRNRTLNDAPPFRADLPRADAVNPTAERVAEHIANEVASNLPAPVRLHSVRVTEAVGCAAIWRPRT